MAAAMEEALQKMRTQERALQARAEASERLSGEIIASMTSGLLVVSQEGLVRILNPAGQRLLGLPDADSMRNYRDVLDDAAPLADVIKECLVARRRLSAVGQDDRHGAGPASRHHRISNRDGTGLRARRDCLFTDLSEVADLEEQLRLKDSLACWAS